jgi:hypothetical protein
MVVRVSNSKIGIKWIKITLISIYYTWIWTDIVMDWFNCITDSSSLVNLIKTLIFQLHCINSKFIKWTNLNWNQNLDTIFNMEMEQKNEMMFLMLYKNSNRDEITNRKFIPNLLYKNDSEINIINCKTEIGLYHLTQYFDVVPWHRG